jgi:LCP family protein required for cell wall assembly
MGAAGLVSTPATRTTRANRVLLGLFKLTSAAISLIILTVSVGGYVVVKWFDGSVTRVHLTHDAARPAPAPPGTQNWLLVGTDSRAGTDGQYGDVTGERSDTTILAHLDANGTTTNVSFPRDTLVTIPAYTDSSGHEHPAHKDKFNAAISLGGPSLLVRTVEDMTGIRIDHYVSVDLAGFKRIADALDGVEVCILPSTAPPEVTTENGITHVSTNISDSYSGFQGHVGYQKVVGDQALAFVRQRHGLQGGDIDRIKRQQQFLGSVFRAATKSGFMFNPVAVTRLLAAISSALTLDQNTSLIDLEKLALRLRGENAGNVRFETIPQRSLESTDTDLGDVFTDSQGILELVPTGQSTSVGSVQVLDQAGFEAMMDQLKDQPATPATAKPSATPAPALVPVPPSQVLVSVEDGVGRAGLVNQVTLALARDGFRTEAAGSISVSPHQSSEVLYPPGLLADAQTLAAAIPGATVTEDSSVTNGVVLIVGANYRSVRAVSAVPQQSASASATPTPTPAPAASVPPAETAASAGNQCTY